MTPRRFLASTINSRTPPVYRRLKPAVKTTRAAIHSPPGLELVIARCPQGAAAISINPTRLLRCARNDDSFPLIVRSGVVEGGADLGRRHRQFGEAPVDRTVDRVGDRRHRWDDVDLADPLDAVGM